MRRPERWDEIDTWINEERHDTARVGIAPAAQAWLFHAGVLTGSVRLAPWGPDPVAACLRIGDAIAASSPDQVLVLLGLDTEALSGFRVHRWERGAGWRHDVLAWPERRPRWAGAAPLPSWDHWVRALEHLQVPEPSVTSADLGGVVAGVGLVDRIGAGLVLPCAGPHLSGDRLQPLGAVR